MPSLRFSDQQAAELSDDLVRRHALELGRRTDAYLAADAPAPTGLPPGAPRLKSLHAVLLKELQRKAGDAAPFLAVDLSYCARQMLRALQAGATYREPAAAALMSAASAFGAMWLGDERLCVHGQDSVPALPEPLEAAGLRAWAEASWAERHRLASRRNRELQDPARYALAHVVEGGSFDSQALRSLADVIFEPSEQDRLRRFLATERALLAAAGLDANSLGDRRVESICLAGDLVYGLGRFVRLAAAARAAGQAAVDPLQAHLRKALDALAE